MRTMVRYSASVCFALSVLLVGANVLFDGFIHGPNLQVTSQHQTQEIRKSCGIGKRYKKAGSRKISGPLTEVYWLSFNLDPDRDESCE